MKKKLVISSVLALSPFFALAQGTCTPIGNTTGATATNATLFNVLCTIGNFLNAIVPVLIALGVVYFVWGVVSYVIASDEEAKAAGKNRMIFGIIGLAVIVGLWGLVNILGRTFGVGSGQNPATTTFPGVVIPPNTP